MAKYLQVSPHIWTPAFRELRNDHQDAHGLYLYLLTCRHRNSEGLFWLPVQYVAIDLGMTEEEVTAALLVLRQRGYVDYDHTAEVVLDRHALDYYKPVGPSQIKGAVNKLEEVPDTTLKSELIRVAFVKAEHFADELCERFPELVPDDLDPLDTHKTGTREGVDTASTLASRARAPREEQELERESAARDREQSAIALVRDELGAEEVKYGTGGDEKW
jgi:hypothetical protein